MDEILADYNEAELELLAGFLQKVTAAGVIAADHGINEPQEKWLSKREKWLNNFEEGFRSHDCEILGH